MRYYSKIRLRWIIYILTLLYIPTLLAQGHKPSILQSFDIERIQRLRPLFPFDDDPSYRLLDIWTADTTKHPAKPTKRSLELLQSGLIGTEIKLSERWTLGLDGAIHIFAQANPDDGAWLGYEVFGAYRPKLGHRLVLRSAHYYTTRSKRWMTEQVAAYHYAPNKSGLAVLSAGITSRETSHLTNEEQMVHMYPSLLGSNGPLSHYRRSYLGLRNSLYLTPHLRFSALALYEYRQGQTAEHPTHQSLLGQVDMYYDFARRATIKADYPTAMQRPVGFFAPEIGISLKGAFAPSANFHHAPFSQYLLAEASLRAAYAWDDELRLKWGIIGGKFLDRTSMTDADERYLPTGYRIGRTLINGTFTTLPPLTTAGRYWAWGYADLNVGRLALPRLVRLDLDEELHLRAFVREGGKRWLEAGYSVGLGEMARVGIFAGWGGDKAFVLATRLSVPLLFLTSTSSTRY